MTALEKTFKEKLKHIPSETAPGFKVLVAKKGKTILDVDWGKTYPYYDLASLTKIMFTTTQFMILESQGRLHSNDRVDKHLPWFRENSKLSELLAHVAGSEWWLPFYKHLLSLHSLYEKRQRLQELIRKLKPHRQRQAVYSDIDFLILGFVMERVCESSLDSIWQNFKDAALPGSHLHFNKNNQPVYARSSYAPTKKCPRRKKIIQGEVHDENTWSLQGVSSHAGLFGRAEDVLSWGLWLRKAINHATELTEPQVVRKYLKRAIPASRGDWSLGFMMPTHGKASCGPHFDRSSVGHTGFTGTSFWFDPKSDVMVVLLANRTYPSSDNEVFRKMRPQIHNMIMETLDGV